MDAETKMLLENEQRNKRITDAINVLFDELNMMNREKDVSKIVVEAVSRQHRTLQQGFFSHVICPIITGFAEMKEKGWYDLRNEQTCKTASKLQETIKDAYFPFI